MEVIKRSRYYNNYSVELKNGRSANLSLHSCRVSCGIKELEYVGEFIKTLRMNRFSDDEIVYELRQARTIIKRGIAAHVIMSLPVTKENEELFKKLAKQREVEIMRPKTNPNSRNKINVIIM